MCPVHFPGSKNAGSKKSERLRYTTRKIRCFAWELNNTEVQEGFSFLSNLEENGLVAYLPQPFIKARAYRIALDDPEALIRSQCLWSQRYTMQQQFLGHQKLSYRVGFKLLFGSEAERQRYLERRTSWIQEVNQLKPGMVF
jgi:hypothetical protein